MTGDNSSHESLFFEKRSMSMKVLEARNITKLFPGVVALDSVDVSFEPGEIHCIIG